MMAAIALGYLLLVTLRRKASANFRSVDAIIPCFNEEACIADSLTYLMRNPYFNRVICVNDGSTDGTAAELARLQQEYGERLVVVSQTNTGKGGALMKGLQYVTTDQVFLTDADTYVPPDKSIGFLLAEIEAGADAAGGIPSSNLRNGAGLLPHIRASVKLPMIIIKRTFQQMLGGAPFIISGACGMFKTEVLRKYPFSDRTKVEDLDLTWQLVAAGHKVRQANRCIVYPQECNTVTEEWKRWRRWIVGYAVCMRLYPRLLITRFGLFSILPMLGLVMLGVAVYAINWADSFSNEGPIGIFHSLFPLTWVLVVMAIGMFCAVFHQRKRLVFLAPLAICYVLLAYAIWISHGIKGLFTGREPARDKPTRYPHVER
ncbi:glycosyltransferase [Solilutibacter pythonis]